MKKIICLSFVFLVFSCGDKTKSEEKKETTINKPTEVEVTGEVILGEVPIPDISTWSNNGIEAIDIGETYESESAILISRLETTKSSYSSIDNLKTIYGSTYKISVVVKKADVGKDFALRMQGVYPNRVDVIFDLSSGKAKEPKLSGDNEFAENPKATIKALGDEWYLCSLYADVYAEYMRIVLGPTNGNLNTTLWETRTGEKNNIYLVPSLLKLEEM